MCLILVFWEEFYTTASRISPKMRESIMDLNCYEVLLIKITAKERLLRNKSEASASVWYWLGYEHKTPRSSFVTFVLRSLTYSLLFPC